MKIIGTMRSWLKRRPSVALVFALAWAIWLVPDRAYALTPNTGLVLVGEDINTASDEQNFLKSGALTCGSSTNGKIMVHTTPLQYCDNAGTPTLQYAAYGNSTGDAKTGDSATAFFGTGLLETTIGGTGADGSSLTQNKFLGSPVSSTGAVTYRVLQDGDIPDGITASNYLPLAGGSMSANGQIVASNFGVEFAESDTNPTCSTGNFNIYSDLSENKLKKCVNGSVSDLDTTGSSVNPVIDATPETLMNIGATSIYITPNGRVTTSESNCRVRQPNGTYDNLEVNASTIQGSSDLTAEVGKGTCGSALTYGGTLKATFSTTAYAVTTATGALTVGTGECMCIKLTSAAGMSNPAYLSIVYQKTA